MIYVWIIHSCGKSIASSLKLSFKTILDENISRKLKKSNVLPVLKKESENLIKKNLIIKSACQSFFPYLVKFMKDFYLIQTNILDKIKFLQIVYPVLFQETLALLKYYQIIVYLWNLFIVAYGAILKGFSSIFQMFCEVLTLRFTFWIAVEVVLWSRG